MPTITVMRDDLEQLLGAPCDLASLEQELESAKAEVKGHDAATGELRIELNDTNRPDLWSPAGIARLLRLRRGTTHTLPATYEVFTAGARDAARREAPRIVVEPALRAIRPFVAGLIVSGQPLDDAGLRALIQSQEKLTENFGRRRMAVAIGAYRLETIRFPIHYRAADPATTRFTPLEGERDMALVEILDAHPKGREYGHLIRDAERYPLLVDDAGEVLSMPPVINSATLGQVVEGDSELFVEVTGHDLRQLMLAINITAVDFADRGATVRPVVIEYPYDTPFGREVVSPLDFVEPLSVERSDVERLLGTALEPDELARLLAGMGFREIEQLAGNGGVSVRPPVYRDDLLHPVDVIEDVAIARNLNTFEPILPRDFTVGTLSPEEELSRDVRLHMIGAGFQEAVTQVLTSHAALTERMLRPPETELLEVDNVMSANFAVLRDTQIPSLLGIEAVSSKAVYPHRIFEIGEVVQPAPEETLGCRTRVFLTALLAHPKATLSELQTYLEAVAFYTGREYSLEPTEHPSFMAGRVGTILAGGRACGLIGEIHPECLERWGVSVPVSVFELDLLDIAG
ncbi:MAG: phenylalanine--tRNA ligase subunit beta [Candidatus Eiseniibacteriota bacterium]|jgi:phenylalanyl-tRNA synthetase beta chain